jgi:N-acetylglutamate synthase-like GNAT family acetyltransferase
MSEILRRALVNEREALEDLQLQASLMGMDDRAALLASANAIDLPVEQIADGNVYVCEAEGEIIGFGVVLPRPDGQADLDSLFVRPDVWGEGYGRLLLEHGAAMARAAGATELHATADARAMGFYLACGFELTGQTQTRSRPAMTLMMEL